MGHITFWIISNRGKSCGTQKGTQIDPKMDDGTIKVGKPLALYIFVAIYYLQSYHLPNPESTYPDWWLRYTQKSQFSKKLRVKLKKISIVILSLLLITFYYTIDLPHWTACEYTLIFLQFSCYPDANTATNPPTPYKAHIWNKW